MEITSQQYDCSTKGHIGKIAKDGWELVEGKMLPVTYLYGCTKCDATSPEPWADWGVQDTNPDHTDSEFCNCFGCKARTLQLSPGDAAANKNGMSQKKWDAELNAYSNARAQGIQPAGTSMTKIRDAVEKSDKAGKAFDANTGGFKG
jgi:hypothetical protein